MLIAVHVREHRFTETAGCFWDRFDCLFCADDPCACDETLSKDEACDEPN